MPFMKLRQHHPAPRPPAEAQEASSGATCGRSGNARRTHRSVFQEMPPPRMDPGPLNCRGMNIKQETSRSDGASGFLLACRWAG
jgi:hypothetical protein